MAAWFTWWPERWKQFLHFYWGKPINWIIYISLSHLPLVRTFPSFCQCPVLGRTLTFSTTTIIIRLHCNGKIIESQLGYVQVQGLCSRLAHRQPAGWRMQKAGSSAVKQWSRPGSQPLRGTQQGGQDEVNASSFRITHFLRFPNATHSRNSFII